MLSLCQTCNRLLAEGDWVRLLVKSRFHVLKSTVSFALDQNDMEFDPTTLAHVSCQMPKGDHDGD